jgi:hypothetical protein
MATALEFDVLRDGYSQSDLVVYLENALAVLNELQTDHATFKTALDAMRTAEQTAVNTPPTHVIVSNFDVKNSVAYEIVVDGVVKTVAANVVHDTGTDTVIATDEYWAAGLLSIDIDGTTATCDFGAEAVDEAGAKALLSVVTATSDVVVGYFTVNAKASEDWVAGTDALTTGSGGQVAQTTNYYNDVKVGALYEAAVAAIAAPASLTNSTALTLTRG